MDKANSKKTRASNKTKAKPETVALSDIAATAQGIKWKADTILGNARRLLKAGRKDLTLLALEQSKRRAEGFVQTLLNKMEEAVEQHIKADPFREDEQIPSVTVPGDGSTSRATEK
jgi:hypothetical protein